MLSLIDIETRRLPNNIVLPTAAVVLGARLLTAPEDWATWLGAGLGAFACFFLLALVYPGGMGMGDVKLALLLGFALGSAVLPALMVGTLAAALAGAVLLVRQGRDARGEPSLSGPSCPSGPSPRFSCSRPRGHRRGRLRPGGVAPARHRQATLATGSAARIR